MEQEGIFYFFRHEQKAHTLIVADSDNAHETCPHQEEARYEVIDSGLKSEDVITDLETGQEIRPAKFTVGDYNFKVPANDLKSEVTTNQPLASGEREIYDYPAGHLNLDQGNGWPKFASRRKRPRSRRSRGTAAAGIFPADIHLHWRIIFART